MIKYLIIDTECLQDYWSFQFKNESMTEPRIIECTSDNHFRSFYNLLKSFKRPMYHYSIDYDTTMINTLCRLVENQETNIAAKMRHMNDLIIQKNVDYFKLNREFWNDFHKNGKDMETTIKKFKTIYNNLDSFDFNLLRKSKIYKNLVINSIPKIYYYYTIKDDGRLIPSISLKNLQLVNEGYKITFDFGKYTSIQSIKNDNLYDKFIEYSLNDVSSLEKLFLDKPLSDIKQRQHAVKAIQLVDKNYNASDRLIYAENNTSLIVDALKIEEPKKDIEINYTEYINTPHSKFNNFVKFVNNNKHIEKDVDLKNLYCAEYEREYIDDDKQVENDILIGSFDELEVNGLKMTFGLGGIHGAEENCIYTNLSHLDYTSQYPSIILQYPELFKNILNIPLYKAIYDLKNTKNDIIDSLQENERIELISGVKLILNSSYGLINSNFKLPISCKNLGRFVCLRGQALLLNLISKLPHTKLINVNTDGIIIQTNDDILDIVKADEDGYFKLGVKHIKNLIQYNVNNYIKDHKTKGMFKPSIKQKINKNERITVNTENAIKLILNKEIEIEPIYFNNKRIGEPVAYYFSSKGTQLIKQVKKPEILCLNGIPMLFTTNKEEAEIELYKEYALKTKENILSFKLIDEKVKNKMYYEYILNPDNDVNNKNKRKIKRDLGKLLGKENIGMSGFKGNIKAECWYKSPIRPLIQYNMTNIMTSTECKSFTLHAKDEYTIFDIDIYKKGKVKDGWEIVKPLIDKLKHLNTFECWNSNTKKYNRKFVVKKCNYKLPIEYSKYIEIIDKAVVSSIDNEISRYDCNWIIPKEFK